jgi:isopentenyl phosphate kinase
MPMTELIFLKLGGSLITDKDRPYTPRLDKLADLAGQIATTLSTTPELQLLVGHGSGSFGHTAAKKHGTKDGISPSPQTPPPEGEGDYWRGFAEVWFQASTLNRHVMDTLQKSGIPSLAFPPSAAVVARDAQVSSWPLIPIRRALANGILPVVYGDVVFDEVRGGTILSTEDLFVHLARELGPQRILLAGLEAGVWEDFPAKTRLINEISPQVYEKMRVGVGSSASADVTGGMASKVEQMLSLVAQVPGLTVQIFSGEERGNLARALSGESIGTRVTM